PLRLLRRAKAVRKASDAELEAIEGAAEGWAEISVWAVVIALAVEAFAAFLPPPAMQIAEFICNAVVALGVAFEVMFGRAGGKAQGELTRRAKDQTTQALILAMGAEWRAAGAGAAAARGG